MYKIQQISIRVIMNERGKRERKKKEKEKRKKT